MALLVSVIHFILKIMPRFFLLAIFTLWFFEWWPVYIPSVAAVAFFYAGAYLAYANISLFFLDRFGLQVVTAYAGILLLDAASKGQAYNSYIHNAGILLGIASLLLVSSMVMSSIKVKKALLWAGGGQFLCICGP